MTEQAGLDSFTENTIRRYIDDKDFVSLENELKKCDIDDYLKDMFLELPKMFGEIDIVRKALADDKLNPRSKAALDNLMQVYQILSERGLENFVSIDLSMVPNLNYYTGIIIKGFTHGVGFPVCAGGRYDNLIANFGRDLPATGVAIGVERVMASLSAEESENEIEKDSPQYVTVALAKGRLAELSVDILKRSVATSRSLERNQEN